MAQYSDLLIGKKIHAFWPRGTLEPTDLEFPTVKRIKLDAVESLSKLCTNFPSIEYLSTRLWAGEWEVHYCRFLVCSLPLILGNDVCQTPLIHLKYLKELHIMAVIDHFQSNGVRLNSGRLNAPTLVSRFFERIGSLELVRICGRDSTSATREARMFTSSDGWGTSEWRRPSPGGQLGVATSTTGSRENAEIDWMYW